MKFRNHFNPVAEPQEPHRTSRRAPVTPSDLQGNLANLRLPFCEPVLSPSEDSPTSIGEPQPRIQPPRNERSCLAHARHHYGFWDGSASALGD